MIYRTEPPGHSTGESDTLMSFSKLIDPVKILILLCVVAAAIVVFESREIDRLESNRARLRQTVAEAETLAGENAEIPRLRAELERAGAFQNAARAVHGMRREVRELRRRVRELEPEETRHEQLKQELADARSRDGNAAVVGYRPAETLQDRGLATIEDAVETVFWAMTTPEHSIAISNAWRPNFNRHSRFFPVPCAPK